MSEVPKRDERTLLDRILDKAEDIASLEILTTAASLVYDQEKGRYIPDIKPDTPSILTKIELIDGDIVTAVHRDTLTGDMQELRAIHKEREEQGKAMINERIALVKELIGLVANLRSARKDSESGG